MFSRALAGIASAVLVVSPTPTGTNTPPTTTPKPITAAATVTPGAGAVRGSARVVVAVPDRIDVAPTLTLEESVAVFCWVNTCSDVPAVERWHGLALEVDLVDEGVLWGPRSWQCWATIIRDESRGDPSQAPHYPENEPRGLTQIDAPSWAKYLGRLGITDGSWEALLDPRLNLLGAVAIRDYQGGSVFPAWSATGRKALCS